MNKLRNVDTGETCTDAEFRKSFPNKCFPELIDVDTLLEHGYELVINIPCPILTVGQTAEIDGTEKDEHGNWVFAWKITNIPDEVVAAKIKSLQNEQSEKIRLERDVRYNGGVLVEGKWFHTDAESVIKYMSLMASTEFPSNIEWKTMDGTKVLMTLALVKSIHTAAITTNLMLFNFAEDIDKTMLTLTDPSKFVMPTNWPLVYTDTLNV